MLLPFNVHAPGDVDGDKNKHIGIRFCLSSLDSVEEIGYDAFSYCTRVTSITIPEKVISIGNNTFDSCTRLTYVTIFDGVESIGEYAFKECNLLETVIIGTGITSIDSTAFFKCTSLKDIYIDKNKVADLVPSGSYTIHWNSTGPTTV